MDAITTKQISKRLSYVLRHNPGDIGLALDEAGWADVEELLAGLARHGKAITLRTLDEVVANNDKQRFAFSEDRTRIRASQGHSIEVALDHTASQRESSSVSLKWKTSRCTPAALTPNR